VVDAASDIFHRANPSGTWKHAPRGKWQDPALELTDFNALLTIRPSARKNGTQRAQPICFLEGVHEVLTLTGC